MRRSIGCGHGTSKAQIEMSYGRFGSEPLAREPMNSYKAKTAAARNRTATVNVTKRVAVRAHRLSMRS
jgi:hypothetical protein